MKVLLIDVNCKHSSTGKIVYELYKRLGEDGHEASVCYGRGEVINEPRIYKFGLDWETNFHAMMARITGLNGYFSYFSTKRLIKYIDEFQPDVIHIHELHAYFVNIKTLINYIKNKSIKLVWTFHCEYMYTGKCGYAYECKRFMEGCGSCPAISDYPKSFFLDRTKKMYIDKYELLKDLNFTIVTPSEWLADRVKLSFLKNKKVFVVYNGIDTDDVFYPRSKDEQEKLRTKYELQNRRIVVSIATDIMNKGKGGQRIIEISKSLEDVTFVLVGTDETKWYSNNVLMVSRTNNQDELAMWYSIADLYLLCSKKETYSMPCAESLACGTPVVGYKAGAPESVFIEPYAKFCEYGDEEELIGLIKTGLKSKICVEVIRKYAIGFSTKCNYERTMEVYIDD